MFKKIKPPISKFSDNIDIAKFNVTWNIFVFLIVVFSGLSIYHLLSSDPNVFTSIGALVFSTFSILLLSNTRKYKASAIIAIVAGAIICQFTMFIIDDSERISDLMWMMLVSFYAFYILGAKWGTLVLTTSLAGLLIKVTLFTENIQQLSSDHHVDTIANVSISTISVVFIIYKLIKSSEVSNAEMKLLNKKLAAQNEEKTVLLKEIHHRVKNNLQVVSSLLRLQANELNDNQTKEQFQEAISRIGSMALIHEKMYQKEELAKLDFRAYLDSLVDDLIRSYANKVEITTTVHSELFQIEIKNVVPIALIFNELITNSLKHAFNDMQKGKIDISITTQGKDVLISYKDNGKWVKSEEEEQSFGIILIDTFTEQLDGKYELNTSNGTEYLFRFSTPRK